eukprot:175644_1
MASRADLLASIRSGTHLQAVPNPTSTRRAIPARPITGRMSLMERMRHAQQRRRRMVSGSARPNTLNETESIWYYVSHDGSTKGPFTIKQLRTRFSTIMRKNSNTYVWNGTTVTQWTPLKSVPQLLNQLKGGLCIHIWYCLSCGRKDNAPHKCSRSQCDGITVLKPKCANCHAIAVENECNKCGFTLDVSASLKIAELKEDERQRTIFLKACDNFNSNADNLMLLMYGFVNDLEDIRIYNNMPLEIMEFIAAFCFNVMLLKEKKDVFGIVFEAAQTKSIWKKHWNESQSNSINRSMLRFDDKNEECWAWTNADRRQSVYGKDVIDSRNKIFRKLWKIQILDQLNVKYGEINISIGIACSDGQLYTAKIRNLKSGDVIDMLYFVQGDTSELSFAVNGTTKDVSISEIPLKTYKLVLVMQLPIKVKLLN